MNLAKPLRPWCWTLCWLALFTGVGSAIYFGQEFWRREVVRLYTSAALINSEGESPDILLIGDSLVRMSFPRDIDSPFLLGADLSWAKVWIPGGSYMDFADLPSIFSKGMGLVLVNQDILLEENFWKKNNIFKWFLNLIVTTLQTGSIAETVGRQQQAIKQTCEREAHITRQVIEKLIYRYSNRPVLSREAIEFLRLLKASSRKLVIVRLPRSISLEKELSASFVSFQSRLLHVLNDEGIQHASLGPAMPDEFYCDGSHPNELGRGIRTEQLVKLVREELSSIR